MHHLLLVFVLLSCLCPLAGADEVKGRELYLSYGCALCHGREGRGDGPNGQAYVPAPTNFHQPQAYHHGQDRKSIWRSIRYGITKQNSIMPAFEDIPSEELEHIIDYLYSLQKIAITDAWVQAMPPSQTVTAAYFTFINNSSQEMVMTSASSSIAAAVEIHQMSRMDGKMRMTMVPQVVIPPKSNVVFDHGGLHLMLIGLKKPAHQGDKFPITLYLQDGSSIDIQAEVRDE